MPTTHQTGGEDSLPNYMEETRMPFGDHLEELRRRLILALLGVVVGAMVGLVCSKTVMSILFQPLFAVQQLHGLRVELLSLAPQASFVVYLKMGFLTGLILAAPWVIYQAWLFVVGGLYPKEQRFLRLFAPVSIGLFAAGVGFMYFIVLPVVLNFFVQFNKGFASSYVGPTGFQSLLLGDDSPSADSPDESVSTSEEGSRDASPFRVPLRSENPERPEPGQVWFNTRTRSLYIQGPKPDQVWAWRFQHQIPQAGIASQFSIDFYTSFVLMLTLAFGLAFQLPIVVVFLTWSGIVTPDELGQARRVIILVIFILAAVLTPPDVLSQILLAIPMLFLFEAGLLVSRMVDKRARARTE